MLYHLKFVPPPNSSLGWDQVSSAWVFQGISDLTYNNHIGYLNSHITHVYCEFIIFFYTSHKVNFKPLQAISISFSPILLDLEDF